MPLFYENYQIKIELLSGLNFSSDDPIDVILKKFLFS
jgi:hypothetical protein